jgi:Domain of unknown function (DUF4259)
MDTWDPSSFGNDTAADWAMALEEADDLSFVETALGRVAIGGTTSIPTEVAQEAVAAAEVVARLRGRWGEEDPYSAPADAWVRAHPMPPFSALIDKAVAALDRVITAPSALLTLWEDSGEADEWVDVVRELRGRLTA